MSQTFKVIFTLAFVAGLGWVLLQPVFDAVEIDTGEARGSSAPDDTPEPSAPSKPTPQPTGPDREPLPETFRTEPLFEPFPASCLEPATVLSDVVAVDRGDRIAAGSLGGAFEEFPAEALAGVSVHGRIAWKADDGGMALADLNLDMVRRLSYARELVWSPFSPCGVVMSNDGSTLLVLPSRRPLVRADVRDAAFSPDGRRLAIVVDGPRATSVWVASLHARRLREVFREEPEARIDLEGWSPDGKAVYMTWPDGGLSFVTTTDPPQSGGISIRPAAQLEHCGPRLLAVIGGRVGEISVRGPEYLTEAGRRYRYISCSPDARFIAAIGRQGLVLLDRNGSFLRDLTEDSGYTDVFVDWGERGRGVIFGRVRAGAPPAAAELWFIPEGGSPQPTGITYRPGPNAVDWAASPPTGLP